jgi:hypothetical protein
MRRLAQYKEAPREMPCASRTILAKGWPQRTLTLGMMSGITHNSLQSAPALVVRGGSSKIMNPVIRGPFSAEHRVPDKAKAPIGALFPKKVAP